MKKRNFISFTVSVAFGLSMILFAFSQISATPGHPVHALYPVKKNVNPAGCPIYQAQNQVANRQRCPALKDINCPGLGGCPGMNPAGKCPVFQRDQLQINKKVMIRFQTRMLNSGTNCPYGSLEKRHRSAYIFTLYPIFDHLERGKYSHEIRI